MFRNTVLAKNITVVSSYVTANIYMVIKLFIFVDFTIRIRIYTIK